VFLKKFKFHHRHRYVCSRRIYVFGPNGEEVTVEWRRLHNKELYALYFSPHIIRVFKTRRSRWAGHEARMRERRRASRVLVERLGGGILLGRTGRRWKDNIKMDLREVGWGYGLDRSGSGQGQVAGFLNAVMNLRVP
jgi:hypothetical protein